MLLRRQWGCQPRIKLLTMAERELKLCSCHWRKKGIQKMSKVFHIHGLPGVKAEFTSWFWGFWNENMILLKPFLTTRPRTNTDSRSGRAPKRSRSAGSPYIPMCPLKYWHNSWTELQCGKVSWSPWTTAEGRVTALLARFSGTSSWVAATLVQFIKAGIDGELFSFHVPKCIQIQILILFQIRHLASIFWMQLFSRTVQKRL